MIATVIDIWRGNRGSAQLHRYFLSGRESPRRINFFGGIPIMNKSELIAEVAAKAEITKKDADAAVTAVIDAITESLKKGDKVQLVGFGTFEVRERGARTGRDPRTNQEIQIPASKAPAFKAGKALKDTVNGK